MHPAADSQDAPLVPRAAGLLLLSSGLQHPTASTPKRMGGGRREVSLTSFTCHLLPTQHSPRAAPMDSQHHPPQPCMPLSRSGCPAEQRQVQQPWAWGQYCPSQPKLVQKAAALPQLPEVLEE